MPYPFSASATDNALACAYSLRPELTREPDVSGVGALTGTAFHALAEAYIMGRQPDPMPAGADVARARRMFDLWYPWWDDYSERVGGAWSAELPFAISTRTGEARVIKSAKHRDYTGAADHEVPGTVDAFTLLSDRVVLVDWKTGSPKWITPAKESGQMRTLALAAMRFYDVAFATVVIVPVSDLAPPTADEYGIDLLDSDLHELRLRRVVESIPTSVPTPGEHCRFCKVRGSCPDVPKRFQVKRKKVA